MTTPSLKHCPILGTPLLFAVVLILFVPIQHADAADSYSGSWNNKKFKTKGSLTATLTKGKGNTWSGVFSGQALGKPFRYKVRFISSGSGNKITLRGNSNVDGDQYQWAAYLVGNNLIGNYRANNGNNGSFSGKKK